MTSNLYRTHQANLFKVKSGLTTDQAKGLKLKSGLTTHLSTHLSLVRLERPSSQCRNPGTR
ncbi:MAG: hypothetical protein F6K50_18265 [Moorea sp. SIO3I7]|uniref:Uncharacterized protein n=1 Tax=Moorena bouillonii PNG TaxID=568701 RepID=A0A1U7N679_9CYAN|nr:MULTISPECIES: hypothetical protein [Moorena]NEN97396.1 hypothetical protein [Moorena sp. SIO3I7]NEO46279.1 hypothetical protein [Moorena sp. SIO4A3]NEO05135.1 hypothetical protein [Moorena sp. SIO3I8]NEO11461.1 hypothetical protein [Moorena sp. SIO3E8]NEO18925.1 hypothetical protein [Moorena sp. SIO4A5]